MDGVVVIGEGEKDEAPMLHNGERIGNWTPPLVDVAVDPVDGTRPTAEGSPGAMSVLALAERGAMYAPGRLVYMEKIAVGPEAAGSVDLEAPVEENLRRVAAAKGKQVEDLIATSRPPDLSVMRRCAAGRRIRLAGTAISRRHRRRRDSIDICWHRGSPKGGRPLTCLARWCRLWPRTSPTATPPRPASTSPSAHPRDLVRARRSSSPPPGHRRGTVDGVRRHGKSITR
jgi:fructose-1,6-bisphosphatase II